MAGAVLKYLALLSVFFSFFAAFVNILVFRSWGLNFAAIASPSDILLGSLNAFDSVAAYLLISVIASTISFYASEKMFQSNIAKRSFPLIYFLTVAVAIFGSVSQVMQSWGLGFLEPSRWIVMSFWFLFSLFWFSLKKYNDGISEIARFLVSFGLISLFAILRFFGGFGGIDLAIDESSRCPLNEYVVWTGVDSLVTTCDPPPFVFPRTYFVVERQGVILTNRIRKGSDK